MHMHPWKHFSVVALSTLICCAPNLLAQQNAKSKNIVRSRLKPTAPANPTTPLDSVIDVLYAAHTFEQVAISPDAKKIAWVETHVGKDGVPDGNTKIAVHTIADEKTIAIGAGRRIVSAPNRSFEFVPHTEGSVAWSPDSAKLAFLSDAEKSGQLQLYVTSFSGPPKKLMGPPDTRKLAFKCWKE